MTSINYQLLKYQSDNIPLFDGNPRLLNRFITAVENLLTAFCNRKDPNDTINICLFDTILNKLTGRAADLVSSRIELNSWTLIKEVLTNSFADQRSIDCLIQDLINLKPLKNEDSMQFGMRIQDSRSLLFSKLNAGPDTNDTKLIKIKHYDEFALKTFINGLPYNLQLVVRLKSPVNLEQAMSFVKEEENFIQFRNTQNFGNRTGIPNRYPKHNTTPLNRPNLANNFNQSLPTPHNSYWPQSANFFRPPSHYPPQNTFPRPAFSNSYHQTHQTRPNFFRTNQSNVFRQSSFTPRPSFGQTSRRANLNRDIEPMDTSSGNTVITPKKNFISHELYNQEILSQAPEEFTPDNKYYPDKFDESYRDYSLENLYEPFDTNYDPMIDTSYHTNYSANQEIDDGHKTQVETPNFPITSQDNNVT